MTNKLKNVTITPKKRGVILVDLFTLETIYEQISCAKIELEQKLEPYDEALSEHYDDYLYHEYLGLHNRIKGLSEAFELIRKQILKNKKPIVSEIMRMDLFTLEEMHEQISAVKKELEIKLKPYGETLSNNYNDYLFHEYLSVYSRMMGLSQVLELIRKQIIKIKNPMIDEILKKY